MSKVLKIILTRGLPASGKTTWAKAFLEMERGNWKRINKDDLRSMIDDGRWSKDNEKFILAARNYLIHKALESGFNVIVDDTNLSPKHEKEIKELFAERAIFEVKDFTDVPLEECIKRDQKRPNYVGEKVIRQMYNQYLRPKPQKVEYDFNFHDAIICDIDGTLALFAGKNPYDRDFSKDEVNQSVRGILVQYSLSHKIIIMSGRMDKNRKVTEEWLSNSGIPYHLLLMRKTDDLRKDCIVKKELYEAEIKGKYNVSFVLDDRNQVVDMWRSLGLTCLQVAEGDF